MRKLLLGGLAASALLTLLVSAAAGALTPVTAGYVTKDNPPLGALVALQKDSSDQVAVASTDNVNNLLGVVVAQDNSPLSLTTANANQIQVASSGVAQVLVSDINGKVYAGDQITASPIKGVGMKATTNTKVVGVAQGNLSNANSSRQTVTDKSGKKKEVEIAQIPVLVSVSYFFKQPDKTLIPPAIQNIANALAGKTVNSLPILISLAIFIVTLIIVVSIIYAMIHSSIISVGRNPMSQAAIYRNLIQLSVLVLGILAVSVIAIYMTLVKIA